MYVFRFTHFTGLSKYVKIMEAYLGHEKKIIILPGQLNVQLSCPDKIIILPGQIIE